MKKPLIILSAVLCMVLPSLSLGAGIVVSILLANMLVS